MQTIDEYDESCRAERDQRTELEKRLHQTGENKRNAAVSRSHMRSSSSDTRARAGDTEDEQVESSTTTRKAKKQRMSEKILACLQTEDEENRKHH